MAKTDPWFRFYTETPDDPKLDRAALMAQCEYASIFTVWGVMMTFAKKSPVEGILLIAKNVPVTIFEIAIKSRIKDTALIEKIILAFQSLDMIQIENEVISLAHWGERQYQSDTSTDRWRKWNDKRKQTEETNNHQTLVKRLTNGPETDTESDTDTDTESDSKGEAQTAPIEEILRTWHVLFPKKPQPKPTTFRKKIETRWKEPDFRENWRTALERASKSPTCQNESWFCFEFFVRENKNHTSMFNNWMAWKDKKEYGVELPDQQPVYAERY